MRRIFGGLGADEALGGLNLGFLKDLLRAGRPLRFWAELKAVRDVDAMRQNLSRTSLVGEHVFDPLVRFRGRPEAPPADLASEHNGSHRFPAERLKLLLVLLQPLSLNRHHRDPFNDLRPRE